MLPAEKVNKEEFISQYAHYSRYHKQFEKAVNAVLQNCVKKHIFRPSGRAIYTVVGNSGDEFLDPAKPYCSCSNFFFRVLGGQEEYCYHLLSYKIASEAKRVEQIQFDDEEYDSFMKLIVSDILANLKNKGGKELTIP